jgi:hypothetical protein
MMELRSMCGLCPLCGALLLMVGALLLNVWPFGPWLGLELCSWFWKGGPFGKEVGPKWKGPSSANLYRRCAPPYYCWSLAPITLRSIIASSFYLRCAAHNSLHSLFARRAAHSYCYATLFATLITLRSLLFARSLAAHIHYVHILRSFARYCYSVHSLRSLSAHIHCVHICSLTIRCAHCSLSVRSRYVAALRCSSWEAKYEATLQLSDKA